MPELPAGLMGFLAGRNQQVAQQQAMTQGLMGLLKMQQFAEDQKTNELKRRQIEQSLTNETGFRDAMSQLGPNPDLSAMAAAAMRFGKPDLAVNMFNAQESRALREKTLQDQLEQRRQFEQMTHEYRMSRLQNDADRAAETARHNKAQEQLQLQMMQLRRDLAGDRAPSVTQIVDPSDPSRMLSIDARAYRGGSMGAPGVIGVSGKEPSAQKRTEQLEGGKKQVSDIIASLNDYYKDLENRGGVISTESGVIPNVINRVARSAVGQTVLGATGNAEASVQNKIEAARPLLMQAIRQATGMSARAMDSNIELQFYMRAATDPTKDIESNRAALQMLDMTYGLGLGIKADPAAVKALREAAPKADRRQPAKAIKRTGTYRGRPVVEYEDGTIEFQDGRN